MLFSAPLLMLSLTPSNKPSSVCATIFEAAFIFKAVFRPFLHAKAVDNVLRQTLDCPHHCAMTEIDKLLAFAASPCLVEA
jgi:hypothetical protein